ncbi:hypothetical protein MKEN_00664000 [Mycena kentingensis (nom. inval.)]|nr:hypothetical protein MKEN_00664000 [Mycena kentingensis (nom. inval.)]
MWLSDAQKIGVALTTFGGLFMLLGVMLFFDGALLALGNILFVSGITLIIGPKKTFYFFARKQKLRGTVCFVGGILLVFLKWPFIGMIVETFGFLNLFGDFFPVIVTFLRQLPFIGTALSLPYIRDVVDHWLMGVCWNTGSPRPEDEVRVIAGLEMSASFSHLLSRRFDAVKARYPNEESIALQMRVLGEFWASNPQSFVFGPEPDISGTDAVDFSDQEAWEAFCAKLQSAEDEFCAEHENPDVDMPDASASAPAASGADANADSDSDSDPEASGIPRPIIKIVSPSPDAPADRALLTGITNLRALRLFSDSVFVRARPRPQGVAQATPNRLVDRNGMQECYEGPTIWVYDTRSNEDGCAKLVYGVSDELYGTATGDSWRARVSHMIELQSEMAVNGTNISFGGLDRYDYAERARNLAEAEPGA